MLPTATVGVCARFALASSKSIASRLALGERCMQCCVVDSEAWPASGGRSWYFAKSQEVAVSSRKSLRAKFKFDIEASAELAAELLEHAGVDGALIGTARTWFDLPLDEQYHTKDLDLAISVADAVWLEKTARDRGPRPEQSPFGGVCIEVPAQGISAPPSTRR